MCPSSGAWGYVHASDKLPAWPDRHSANRYHHRLHHRGAITITGPAEHLVVTDPDGTPLDPGSMARTPKTPPPAVPPCPGPTGERANWWWYQPYEPQPPPSVN